MTFPDVLPDKLRELGLRLLDQRAARILAAPQGEGSGYWFGGGNLVQEPGGDLLLCGRYRNPGDARTGVGAGERGLEFAVFRGADPEGEFQKIVSLFKSDLSTADAPVVSIEGGCLLPAISADGAEAPGLELYVSTEKGVPYPKSLIHFQKPGAGVWSMDRIFAPSGDPAEFAGAAHEPVLASSEGGSLHLKDPVAFRDAGGNTQLLFCSHPFTWASSNTGLATRKAGLSGAGDFELVTSGEVLPRGPSWDVACSRVTERLSLPQAGILADLPPASLYFYDGAECLRPLEQNRKAARRPRGYSCEELGGLAWGFDEEFPKMRRLSADLPLFLSPHATGCSRYVSALFLEDGSLVAAWQQADEAGSQPLVSHRLSAEEVGRILAG